MIFALQFTLQFNIVIPLIMLQSLYLLKWKDNILVLTLVGFYIRQKWIMFQFKKFIITTVSSLNCLLLTDYVSVTSKTFKFNSMMWEPVHLEYDLKVVNGLIYKSLFKKLSSFPKFGCKKFALVSANRKLESEEFKNMRNQFNRIYSFYPYFTIFLHWLTWSFKTIVQLGKPHKQKLEITANFH